MEPFVAALAPSGSSNTPLLVCSVAMDSTTCVVHLAGELDVETSVLLGAVVQEQIEQGHVDLHVDLGALVFCDLHGLYALRAARRGLQGASGHLTLARPTPFLQKVATLCGLQDLFDRVVPA